jgi:hypothetical protein
MVTVGAVTGLVGRQDVLGKSLLYSLVADLVASPWWSLGSKRWSPPPVRVLVPPLSGWQRWCTTGINDDTRSSSGHQTNATRSALRRDVVTIKQTTPSSISCYTVIGIARCNLAPSPMSLLIRTFPTT